MSGLTPSRCTRTGEIALDELERTGAFGRSHLLLISPTGTGWVDQTMIESAELLTRGDIATCAIQYGRYPSFLCTQKVPVGRAQFRALLWGVRQRLTAVPPDRRPRVLVFGESLGAWASSDVTMRNGVAGLDEYGVDRALWFGLPGLAVWSKTGMKEGRSPLVPPGIPPTRPLHLLSGRSGSAGAGCPRLLLTVAAGRVPGPVRTWRRAGWPLALALALRRATLEQSG